MLALAAPSEAQKPPTGQSVQLMALKPSLNLPAVHAMHVSELSEGWCFPAGHSVQVADLVDEEVPAGHVVHVVAPVAPLELFPASHGWQ